MRSVSNSDIASLKQKVGFEVSFHARARLQIEQLNKEIMELADQRDKKDEASEDKLTIYRHQSNNVQRKKANVADQLQSTRLARGTGAVGK